MTEKVKRCKADGCREEVYAKDLCNKHYWRARRRDDGSTDDRDTIGADGRVTVRLSEETIRRARKAAGGEGLATWCRKKIEEALED